MARESGEEKEKKFISDMLKRFDKAYKKEKKNREAYVDDVKFSVGIGQWEQSIATDRATKHRPMLQFDQLSTPIRRLVGEMRMNRVHAKVRPMSSSADTEVAKIMQGVIYEIQHRSDADRIYDYAGEMICRGGYGAWAVRTRYTNENPFLQEIYMERIPNPMTVFLDADCKDECYADAKEGWEISKIPLEKFHELYGDYADVVQDMKNMSTVSGKEHWWDGSNLITIADYYQLVPEKQTVVLLNDGQWFIKGEEKDVLAERKQQIEAWEQRQKVTEIVTNLDQGAMPPPPQPPPEPLEVIETKETEIAKLRHWKVCGSKILSPKGKPEEVLKGSPMAGSYIPLLLGKGPEVNVDGEPVILSYIRFAKDPVRAYNYWITAAAETVALAGKQPIMATPEQTAGYENLYDSAGTENYSRLPYNAVEGPNGQLVPPPGRLTAPNPPVAMFAEADRSKHAIEDALGVTPRDTMGQVGPERSEVAIAASQKPASIANSVFFDNLLRTIQLGCRVMLSMIPDIIDSVRDIRIRNYDDTEYFVPVNTTAKDAIKRIQSDPAKYAGIDLSALQKEAMTKGLGSKYNDLKAGKYGLLASYGPAYLTMRQESFKLLMGFMENDPKAKSLLGDLALRSSDFEFADEAAERWRATLPPGLVPPDPRKPQRKLQPNPMMIAKQKEAEAKGMKVQVERQKVEVQKLKTMVEVLKVSKEAQDTEERVKKVMLSELYRMFSDTHPGDQFMQQMGSAALPNNLDSET